MEWLNINRSTLDSEPMQDAASEARGVWLFLVSYCAGQENGGRIKGAKLWNDRKCLKQLSLSREELDRVSGLWRWEADDLMVEFYPRDAERKLQAQRVGGRAGGRKSGEARRGYHEATHEGGVEGSLEGKVEATHEGGVEGSLEGKVEATHEGGVERKGREGKERKGKERKRDALLEVPSIEEVMSWAAASEVPGEFAREKWAATSERHGWHANGRLIDWRSRWLRFWAEDRRSWLAIFEKKDRAGRANGGEALMREGDQSWWWSEPLETVERALMGALLADDQKNTARLREVLQARKGNF